MQLPRPAPSRRQVALAVLAVSAAILLVGAVRVADYHPLADPPDSEPVAADASPREILERTSAHLSRTSVTIRGRTNVTEATGLDTDAAPVRYVYRVDPVRNRAHAYMYHDDGDGTWTTSCSFLTDGPSIARTGTVHGATPPAFCETGGGTWHSMDRSVRGSLVQFHVDDWQGPPRLADAWTVGSRNRSLVVLRTTGRDAFAAVDGRPVDEDVANGSYTVVVDGTTGRLRRVERQIAYRTGDGVRREVTVYRFSRYGRTDVTPPDALGHHSPDELIDDLADY